jgi:hypothetical protein
MLTFDPITHRYFEDGRRVPSVTQVMGLLYHEVFRWGNVAAMERGSDVHARVEKYEKGQLRTIERDYAGYLDAWIKFRNDHRLGIPTIIETPMYSKRWGFAGTPDHVFGDLLVDIKTSPAHCPLTAIQTSAYKQLIDESGAPKIKRRMEVLLRPTGKYDVLEFKDFPSDFRRFQCCLSLYQFMVKNYQKANKEAQDGTVGE